jgi:Glycosyl hydrolase family 1
VLISPIYALCTLSCSILLRFSLISAVSAVLSPMSSWNLLWNSQKFGGWLGAEVQDAFAVYAEECYKAFGDRVKQWLTLNEPWSFVRTGYSVGVFPPGRCRYTQLFTLHYTLQFTTNIVCSDDNFIVINITLCCCYTLMSWHVVIVSKCNLLLTPCCIVKTADDIEHVHTVVVLVTWGLTSASSVIAYRILGSRLTQTCSNIIHYMLVQLTLSIL